MNRECKAWLVIVFLSSSLIRKIFGRLNCWWGISRRRIKIRQSPLKFKVNRGLADRIFIVSGIGKRCYIPLCHRVERYPRFSGSRCNHGARCRHNSLSRNYRVSIAPPPLLPSIVFPSKPRFHVHHRSSSTGSKRGFEAVYPRGRYRARVTCSGTHLVNNRNNILSRVLVSRLHRCLLNGGRCSSSIDLAYNQPWIKWLPPAIYEAVAPSFSFFLSPFFFFLILAP